MSLKVVPTYFYLLPPPLQSHSMKVPDLNFLLLFIHFQIFTLQAENATERYSIIIIRFRTIHWPYCPKKLEENGCHKTKVILSKYLILFFYCFSSIFKVPSLQVKKATTRYSIIIMEENGLHCKYIRCKKYTFFVCPEFPYTLAVYFKLENCMQVSAVLFVNYS